MRPFRFLPLLLAAWVAWAQATDLAAKSRQGKQLMAAGKFAQAARVYEEMVWALPNNAGLLLNLGMARQMAGQPEKAIGPLESALKLQPGIVPALLFLGSSYLDTGQAAKAIGPLSKLVEAKPSLKQARRMLGDALTARGRLEQASVHYRRWTELDPSHPQAWYSLGLNYETLSQKMFEELKRTAPESVYMLALVGQVRLSQLQHRSAFYLFRTALGKRPDMKGLHAGLAVVYEKTGHADWAAIEREREKGVPAPDCGLHKLECEFREGRFLAVTAARDDGAESLYWRSRAYNQLAKEAFESLERLPPSVEGYEFMARLNRTQGRHLDAVRNWKNALALAPGNTLLETELAISLSQSRNYKAAQPILLRLLKSSPDSAQLNFYLGDSFLNLQEPDKAVVYLNKSVAAAPKFLPGHASLGRAYLMLRKGAAAIPHLEAALPLDSDGSIHFQLARAYQRAGQREQARAMMTKYQKIRQSATAEKNELDKVQITGP